MRIKTGVSLILTFLLLVSSFTVASRGVAIINASEPPTPVGVQITIGPNGSVRYVNSSDYFYVRPGFIVGNWSILPADVQNAFLDPQQNNFTLHTSAPNFENPPMTQITEYHADYPWPPYEDVMLSVFFFQFHPGDLAPGNYTFTGTWSSTALANPPSYEVLYYQSTITLVVLYDSTTKICCKPNPVQLGQPAECNATVYGFNPTGTVIWNTTSHTGSFSQSVCTLSSGSCVTYYTPSTTGIVIITAYYRGDSANGPSIGIGGLTVFVLVTKGVNVKVHPIWNLELTFANVTAEGYATADNKSAVEAPPLANLVGQYYDVNVTASYSGNVAVSLTYDDANMTQQQESNLQMMQYTPMLGDIVDYGQVNIMDITFVAKCFGTTSDSPRWNATADIDGDGKIDILDISICAKNFGKTAEWTNITTYVDTELNIVRGETAHFSIIGIH